MDLLAHIPVTNFHGKVIDNNPDVLTSIVKLDDEAKIIKELSMECSLAAYRSRIVQMTYIYNSMISLATELSEEPRKIVNRIIEELHDEINGMWEAYREW